MGHDGSHANAGGQLTVAFNHQSGGSRFQVSPSHELANGLQRSQEQAVMTDWAVRRLTPTECERLQGAPDDWTNITRKGKPIADGPRYKMIGNSMAVPVMRWIGQRIDLVEVSMTHQSLLQR
jgi:DNA (cytosine-5)-methyltransferase 1